MAHEKLIVIYSPLEGVGQTTIAVQLACTLAKQDANVLLIDWDARGNGAAMLGLPVTGGLHHWIMNEAPGGARLGHERYRQATAVPGLALLAGWQTDERVRSAVIHGHLSELMWASKFDYVVCDASARQTTLQTTLLRFQPGTVIIPVALTTMNLPQVAQARATVQALAPRAQVILAPTFLNLDVALTVANHHRLTETYPGAVGAAQPDPDALPQIVRWIQRGPTETLFDFDDELS